MNHDDVRSGMKIRISPEIKKVALPHWSGMGYIGCILTVQIGNPHSHILLVSLGSTHTDWLVVKPEYWKYIEDLSDNPTAKRARKYIKEMERR